VASDSQARIPTSVAQPKSKPAISIWSQFNKDHQFCEEFHLLTPTRSSLPDPAAGVEHEPVEVGRFELELELVVVRAVVVVAEPGRH
jgi:hypothetical protein